MAPAEPLALAVGVAVYGLAAGALALFAHALPWPADWKKHKPLSCPVCLTGWATIALAGTHYLQGGGNLLDPATYVFWFAVWGVGAALHVHVRPPEVSLT